MSAYFSPKIESHWLSSARRLLSPNRDKRPDAKDISLVVVHCISLPPKEFGGDYISQLFLNKIQEAAHSSFQGLTAVHVSSHLLIDRSGGIQQFVPFNERAWHAGESTFEGRMGCNDFSIGIELEGDDCTPYTDQQYSLLAAVIRLLMQSYPKIKSTRLVGHSDIAPERKTDPGPHFDWHLLRHKLEYLL